MVRQRLRNRVSADTIRKDEARSQFRQREKAIPEWVPGSPSRRDRQGASDASRGCGPIQTSAKWFRRRRECPARTRAFGPLNPSDYLAYMPVPTVRCQVESPLPERYATRWPASCLSAAKVLGCGTWVVDQDRARVGGSPSFASLARLSRFSRSVSLTGREPVSSCGCRAVVAGSLRGNGHALLHRIS